MTQKGFTFPPFLVFFFFFLYIELLCLYSVSALSLSALGVKGAGGFKSLRHRM